MARSKSSLKRSLPSRRRAPASLSRDGDYISEIRHRVTLDYEESSVSAAIFGRLLFTNRVAVCGISGYISTIVSEYSVFAKV